MLPLKCYPLERDGSIVLWGTPYGYFWGPDRRDDMDQVVSEQLSPRHSVRELWHAYDMRLVRPDSVVIDGGAHVGVFTRMALNRGAAKVVAFEPNGGAAVCFQRTFAKEISEGSVVFVEKALWLTEGELPMGHEGLGFSHKPGGDRIPCTTIDAAVAELGLPVVHHIKLDVEGAEKETIRGAKHTLQEHTPSLAVCMYHQHRDREGIPDALKETAPGFPYKWRFTHSHVDSVWFAEVT